MLCVLVLSCCAGCAVLLTLQVVHLLLLPVVLLPVAALLPISVAALLPVFASVLALGWLQLTLPCAIL